MRRFLWLALFITGLAAVYAAGDFTHFTWWSLASFTVYAGLGAIGEERQFFWLFAGIETCVMVGVWTMSAAKCNLLVDAFNEHGPTVYFIGNFAMHYAPLLVALAFLEDNPIHDDGAIIGGNLYTGFGIFLAYSGLLLVNVVYGCDFQKSVVPIGSFCGITILYICITSVKAYMSKRQTYI